MTCRMTRNSGRANNPSIQLKSMALVPPLSGGMTIQHFARHPVLVNNRLSAACYRTQTLASMMAKSQNNLIPDVDERLVRYLSDPYAGRIHGKKICDEED